MTLNKTWEIVSVLTDPDTGKIRFFDFRITFRDPAKPGVESVHGGRGATPMDGIDPDAGEAALLALVQAAYEPHRENVEAFHEAEIERLYIEKNGTVVVPPYATGWSSYDVNAERNKRIASGCEVTVDGYGTIPLQGTAIDQTNLQALAFAASMRVMAGDIVTPTIFRDARNQDHSLTPPQVLDMWRKGTTWIEGIYKASWVIKAMSPIPIDFRDDSYWVSSPSA